MCLCIILAPSGVVGAEFSPVDALDESSSSLSSDSGSVPSDSTKIINQHKIPSIFGLRSVYQFCIRMC